jgi:hypothetical protein
MTPRHDRLTDLPEAELVWLARFADSLRERSPVFSADEAGFSANEAARNALDDPRLGRLRAEQAAARWLATQPRT